MSEQRIVFDGPPGPEAGRFVEVEDERGYSIDAGEWTERADGLWELRLYRVKSQEQIDRMAIIDHHRRLYRAERTPWLKDYKDETRRRRQALEDRYPFVTRHTMTGL